MLNNYVDCFVQQHENGGGVGSQVPMGVSHEDDNAFTSYTNLLMVFPYFSVSSSLN